MSRGEPVAVASGAVGVPGAWRAQVGREVRSQLPLVTSLVLVVATWEVVGRTAGFLYLPPLSEVVRILWRMLGDGTIARELRASLAALGGGMGVAILAGVVTGTLMGLFPMVQYALDVYLDAAMAAPMVAFVPVFILVFGLGYVTRIVTVIVFAFFPIVVNTFTGIRSPNDDLIQMGRSFGATPGQSTPWVLWSWGRASWCRRCVSETAPAERGLPRFSPPRSSICR